MQHGGWNSHRMACSFCFGLTAKGFWPIKQTELLMCQCGSQTLVHFPAGDQMMRTTGAPSSMWAMWERRGDRHIKTDRQQLGFRVSIWMLGVALESPAELQSICGLLVTQTRQSTTCTLWAQCTDTTCTFTVTPPHTVHACHIWTSAGRQAQQLLWESAQRWDWQLADYTNQTTTIKSFI